MLNIDEEPEPRYELATQLCKHTFPDIRCNHCIGNCNPAIKGKLGNLCGRKLSIGISKLYSRTVLNSVRCESCRSNTIVARFLDSVIDR